jgi:ferritin-like metal-binding protein YciE
MPETSTSVIRRYLEDAIAAERSFETQLRAFAKEADDDEVMTAFAAHADETKLQLERLTARLDNLGGSPSTAKSFLAHLFALTPKTAQIGHQQEERTTQNLIIAYTVESSENAMYEALQAVAEAAGDVETQRLAQQIQREEQAAAAKFWGFLRSRAKIAFNLLTATETDPTLNTRSVDNRIIE